ncbi:MAG TPA: ROK family transcriptional regulator [Mycobacteriales bacterium]|nr:ROK family transcriptional regulator [Mycobacteriales bacterium]
MPTPAGGGARSGARAPLIGNYNRSLVFESIRISPDSSRVEIAARTGLTGAAVSNIVRALMNDGLVIESGRAASTGGKPATRLRINSTARHALGVHLDPQAIIAVIADLDGTIVGHKTVRLRTVRKPAEQVLGQAATIADELIAEAGIDRATLTGAGAACPGPIDAARGLVLGAPNLPGWVDIPVREILEQQIGCAVTIENDANAAAIGEKWIGVAQTIGDFLYVYLGAGIGGAVFLDHHLYRGCSGNAGAIGHLLIQQDGRPCACGNVGCLETVCSQYAIIDKAHGLPEPIRTELELQFRPRSIAEDHRKILRAAVAGHARASAIVTESARQLGDAVASLINVLDVGTVILGGHAIADAGDLYLAAVRDAVRDRPVARRTQHIQVMRSSPDVLAGAVGAASVVFHDLYTPRIQPSFSPVGV